MRCAVKARTSGCECRLLERAGNPEIEGLFLLADRIANQAQEIPRAKGIFAAAAHEFTRTAAKRAFQKPDRFRGALLFEKENGVKISHLRISRKSLFAEVEYFARFLPALLFHENDDHVAQDQRRKAGILHIRVPELQQGIDAGAGVF
jgi:hypothetical protein